LISVKIVLASEQTNKRKKNKGAHENARAPNV